jgi:putative FmdB family regulatory protein
MPMYDFKCPDCECEIDELVKNSSSTVPCPECGKKMKRLWRRGPVTLTTIIPSYPGSLKQKAGYVHSHGDRPATKVQSGFGGCQNPKS